MTTTRLKYTSDFMVEEHPTKEIRVRGKDCLVDEEIVSLVEALNSFEDSDGGHPFETVMSCQESRGVKDFIGGEFWVDMKPFSNFEDAAYRLIKIIDDAYWAMVSQHSSGSHCRKMALELDAGPFAKRKDVTYIPSITVDCSTYDYGQGYERADFEKKKKEAVKHLVESIKLNSGRTRTRGLGKIRTADSV